MVVICVKDQDKANGKAVNNYGRNSGVNGDWGSGVPERTILRNTVI